ncbi:DUF4261 domain-containing protein [Myroides phaeus]|uniref:DUF4261 domain-containing protein n=1 Tax=Myroides phaeus TaxID=702745 RepID=UPI002DB81C1F|nr:DUF4261 domain-containing protein [Myroides phaeus]MEC4116583.1 DUF4261 domain-containing protein [Myroides phaeus]
MKHKKIGNAPKIAMFKLLYTEKPTIDMEAVLTELHKVYPNASYDNDANVFIFPDCQIELKNGTGPAQCVVLRAEDDQKAELTDAYFQQNWHWPEAEEAYAACKYEIVVTDFLSRSLDPRIRIVLVQQLLAAMIKVSNPQVIVSVHGQKLLDTQAFVEDCKDPNYIALDLFINVRLYNVEETEQGRLLMDTVGLHALGLSDLQIFYNDDSLIDSIANRLWDYAYYLAHVGEVIEDGNTVQGLEESQKWVCNKVFSVTEPERTVLDIKVS